MSQASDTDLPANHNALPDSTVGSSAPEAALKAGERLSIPRNLRVPGGMALGFFGGMGLGFSHGGKMAGLRFRAENAHRLPTSQANWYLYHKSKNYHVMLEGAKEGMKMGVRTSIWTGGFLGLELYLDDKRETSDFLSSAFAGLGTGALFSIWSKFL